jgi:predicted GNAT family acetyltransferase
VSAVVTDHRDQAQFVAEVEGKRAGVAEYMLTDQGVLVLTHTEVNRAYEGRGVGSALARAVLDQARARQLSVFPICPFMAGWIDRHRDYADLLYRPKRSSVGD